MNREHPDAVKQQKSSPHRFLEPAWRLGFKPYRQRPHTEMIST